MPKENQSSQTNNNKEGGKKEFRFFPKYDNEAQGLKNAGAGVALGLSKAVTSWGTLALDIGDSIDNAIGDFVPKKTIQELHQTLDKKDEILDITGADPKNKGVEMVANVTEVGLTALQILSGIGAAKGVVTAVKGGKKLNALRNFTAAGIKENISAGAKAVQSGSTGAKIAKGAAVAGAEEFVSSTAGDEDTGAVTGIYDMIREQFDPKDRDTLLDVDAQVMMGIEKIDPELAAAGREYMNDHIKKEEDSFERLKNRFRHAGEGAVLGGAAETAFDAMGHLFKYWRASKHIKAGINRVNDGVEVDTIVEKEIAKKVSKGEEVTEETVGKIFDEAKAKQKEARKTITDFEGNLRKVDEKYLNKHMDKYNKLEQSIVETQSPDAKRIFEKMASNRPISKEETKIFLNEAKRVFKFNKSTSKQLELLGKANVEDASAIMSDPNFLDNLRQELMKADAVLDTQKLNIEQDLGSIYGKMARGEGKPEDLMVRQRLQELLRNVEAQQKVSGSLAGQALQRAKKVKSTGISDTARLLEDYKKTNNLVGESTEYLEYAEKVLSDRDFRAQELGNYLGGKGLIGKLNNINIEANLHNIRKANLVTGMSGIVRNMVEGGVISPTLVVRDTIGEVISPLVGKPVKVGTAIRSMKDAVTENAALALQNARHAFQGKDMNSLAKFAIDELGDTDKRTLYQSIMSLGQRTIAGSDQLISTFNRAYYVNREANTLVTDLLADETRIKNLVSAFKTGEGVDGSAIELSDLFSSHGMRVEEVIKKYDEVGGDMGKLGKWYKDNLQNSPTLADGAKRYSDRITMNSDTADLENLNRFLESEKLSLSFSKSYMAISKTPWLRFSAPFPKPTLTGLDMALELNPVVSGLNAYKAITKGSPEQKRKALANFGMVMTASKVIWELRDSGIITGGGPRDGRDSQMFGALGNKEYHLQIGGDQIGVRGSLLEPLIAATDMIRDMKSQHSDGSVEDEKRLNVMTTSLLMYFASGPYDTTLDSLQNVLNSFGDDNVKSQAARSQLIKDFAVKTIPVVGATAVGELRNITDPYKRDVTTTETGLHGQWLRFRNEVLNTMPAASYSVPTKYSFITGEKMEHGKVGLTPFTYFGSSKENSEVREYMTKLITRTGLKTDLTRMNNLRFTLPSKTMSIQGLPPAQSFKLNSDEYAELTIMTSNPRGMPPLATALQRIVKNNPLERVQTQRQKDILIGAFKSTIDGYKKAAREEFKRTNRRYRAHAIDSRRGEIERRSRRITIE